RRARHCARPGRRRGEHRQRVQSRGRRDLRRRDPRRRPPVRAAAERGEATRLQAGRGRVPHRARCPDRHGRRVRRGRGVRQAHVGPAVKRLGVEGSMVWDTIYGRDPAQPAADEWVVVAYSLDALYLNFISGYETDLPTAQLLRHSFRRFLYADLHSLFLGKEPDGTRVPRPLPQAPAWFGCFDYVQLNEEEFAQLGDDPLALAAGALAQGCNAVCVTLGARG